MLSLLGRKANYSSGRQLVLQGRKLMNLLSYTEFSTPLIRKMETDICQVFGRCALSPHPAHNSHNDLSGCLG